MDPNQQCQYFNLHLILKTAFTTPGRDAYIAERQDMHIWAISCSGLFCLHLAYTRVMGKKSILTHAHVNLYHLQIAYVQYS